MGLAQICDPNLTSRNRNQDVSTEAWGDIQYHYLGVCARVRCLNSHSV